MRSPLEPRRGPADIGPAVVDDQTKPGLGSEHLDRTGGSPCRKRRHRFRRDHLRREQRITEIRELGFSAARPVAARGGPRRLEIDLAGERHTGTVPPGSGPGHGSCFSRLGPG